MLARCSLVNRFGHVLYDKYVAPQEWVTDFRTKYSGIRVHDVRSEKGILVSYGYYYVHVHAYVYGCTFLNCIAYSCNIVCKFVAEFHISVSVIVHTYS